LSKYPNTVENMKHKQDQVKVIHEAHTCGLYTCTITMRQIPMQLIPF